MQISGLKSNLNTAKNALISGLTTAKNCVKNNPKMTLSIGISLVAFQYLWSKNELSQIQSKIYLDHSIFSVTNPDFTSEGTTYYFEGVGLKQPVFTNRPPACSNRVTCFLSNFIPKFLRSYEYPMCVDACTKNWFFSDTCIRYNTDRVVYSDPTPVSALLREMGLQ